MPLYWTALESNPDVLTKYIHKLGVKDAVVVDVLGLDPELLAMLPQPVKALILLFPSTDTHKAHRKEEEENLQNNPQEVASDLFYMKQTIRNACGTIAITHAVLNNLKFIELEDGSVLKNFYEKAKDLSVEERGKLLESDSAFTEVHQELAQEGQTATPSAEDQINHHFIAFVNVNGELYELDGSKNFPIKHGKTNDVQFFYDAANICKEFMARDPEQLGFTLLALHV